MTHPKIRAALKKLPHSVHEMAAQIEETEGKAAAAHYLKQQIRFHDPSIKFASEIKQGGGQKERKKVSGEPCLVNVRGVDLPGFVSFDGEWLVSRPELCKAFGWSDKKLTKLPRTGEKWKLLNEAGYTFQEFRCIVAGVRSHPVYLLLSDAEKAVSALGGVMGQGVSNAA